MNKVSLNTISLNSSSLNAIGEVKMGDSGGVLPPVEKPIGVFIYTTDGEFITTDNWDTTNNNKAVGVYLGIDTHSFVIAKESASFNNNDQVEWGGYNIEITDVINDYNKALLDYDGVGNTRKLIFQLSGITDEKNITGAPAAETCVNYTFPNGQNGYLGSAGEWELIKNNYSLVNEALCKINGDKIINWTWTSNPYTLYEAIYADCQMGVLTVRRRYDKYYFNIRPFLAL